MKEVNFRNLARIAAALVCFAAALFTHSTSLDDGYFIFGSVTFGVIILCYGRCRSILFFLRALLSLLMRKLGARATKVQLETRCLVVVDGRHCLNMADYVITTSVHDPEGSISGPKYRDINCCREHHPHRDKESRGQQADELIAMCKRENLSIHYISPILRYRIK